MNRSVIQFSWGLALTLTLAACDPSVPASPPLEGARMGGPFSLINQDGRHVSDTSFAGQYRLVYFGYSFCPDVCPNDVQRLMQGYVVLEKADKAKAAKLVPIFITVDPKRDTPDALRQFVSAFHPKLVGLTGSEAEIEKVAAEFGVYFEREKPGPQGAYLVNHSNVAVLYGPKGEPIAIIPKEEGPQAVADELARWIK
jgi:protein SCO1